METRRQLTRKDLKADMEEIFLRSLLSGPVHGYRFLTDIKKNYGIPFSASEIYPLLHSLEENGYVSSKQIIENGRARRLYHAIPVKTTRRLKEIISTKNQNRTVTNRKPARFLNVQLRELPAIEVWELSIS